MKITANSHYQNFFKLTLLNVGVFLCLTPLVAYPLPVQTQSPKLIIHDRISQTDNQSQEITYERLEIGGVKLSMPEAEVEKFLGQPLEIKNGDIPIAGKTRTLLYSGITVELLDDAKPTGNFSVYEIKANSSQYKTKDGVKVGDSVSTVMSIYGKPQGSDTNTEAAVTLGYTVNNPSLGPAYLTFTIQDGKVTKITCGYLLN